MNKLSGDLYLFIIRSILGDKGCEPFCSRKTSAGLLHRVSQKCRTFLKEVIPEVIRMFALTKIFYQKDLSSIIKKCSNRRLQGLLQVIDGCLNSTVNF